MTVTVPVNVGTRNIYNWNFSDSTTDIIESRDIDKALDAHLERDSDGLKLIGFSDYSDNEEIINFSTPNEMDICSHNYSIDIYLGDVELDETESDGFLGVSNAYWHNIYMPISSDGSEFHFNIENNNGNSIESDTLQASLLSGSHIKINYIWNEDNHLIVLIYINNDLVLETPEYDDDNNPFFLDKQDMIDGGYNTYPWKLFYDNLPHHPNSYMYIYSLLVSTKG